MSTNECEPTGCTTVATDDPMRRQAPADPVAGRCSPGYPQGIAADAPCGDTDPCMADGTTLWGIQPCTTTTSTTVATTLPSTGAAPDISVLGGMCVAVGAFLGIARRRRAS